MVANGARTTVALDRSELPDGKDVRVESIAIGSGKHVVHVVVPSTQREGIAWEAVVAAGYLEPIFAGVTGFAAGDPGERTGKAVRIVPHGERSFVLVGEIREDLRICGQAWTQLEPLALYPASMELRPATAQRLSQEQQQGAQQIVATDAGAVPAPSLARLLVARGSSVPGSRGLELTDGDPRTVWSERRPGMGQGEFVTMAAPQDVPITRMQVVIAPPDPDANGAAPRTFYLVTSADTYEVTLPGDGWLKPGEAYEIALPRPAHASCVSVVLNDAYTRNLPHPDVGIAELVAYSEFDGPGVTLDDVAKKLSSDRGLIAAQVLERAGPPALEAAARVYSGLDARGRAFAIDVAASHEGCVDAAPLLARGLCEKEGEAPRKAREKLERCRGAAPALASILRDDPAARACVAPTFTAIAGADALGPLADALAATPESDDDVRRVLRRSLAQALDSAPAGSIGALVDDTRRGAGARLEILRAAGKRVVESPTSGDRALADILAGTPTLRVRYLALGPLGELAHGGDGAAARRIGDVLSRDPEWPVRARAAEQASGLPALQVALLGAARDPEPRVREAALQSLAESPDPAAVQVASSALAADGWSFVKAQAVSVLAHAAPSADIDRSLRDALRDSSVRVRAVALHAVALRHTRDLHEAVRERLDDPDEEPEVRAAAAAALGAVCDGSSVDRLTELASTLGVPGTAEDDQQIALGALVGLAAIHPADLRGRLSRLLGTSSPPYVRAAAAKALAAPGVCH